MKSVTAPPLTSNVLATEAIDKWPPVTLTFPEPELIVVVDVVLVEPRETVLAAAPVPIDNVVADASVLIPKAPVPEFIVKAPLADVTLSAPDPLWTVVADVEFVDPKVVVLTPAPVEILTVVAAASELIERAPVPEFAVNVPLVEVMANAPDPDCNVVAEVELVEPSVNPFTAAPVAIVTVVAEASLLTDKAPVPELIVRAPFVDVTFNAPEPDRTVVVDVVLVEPKVAVLTPAPVATLTVVAAASAEIPIVPVPEANVRAALVAVKEIPPLPEVIPTEVAPVALPNVFTLAPVVANVVAPAEVKVVVTEADPGATNADGILKVREFNPPVVVIWLVVPAIVTDPLISGTTGFVPASGTKESMAAPPPVKEIVRVPAVPATTTPLVPTIAILPATGAIAPPLSPVKVLSGPVLVPNNDQLAVVTPPDAE